MIVSIPTLQAVLASLVALAWSGDVPQPPAHETAIKVYYDAHASEKNGRCKAPYIEDFHRVDVVEDNAEQVVVETRYRYRDWLKDRQAWRIGSGRSTCVAVSTRRFVLVRSKGRLQVAEMGAPHLG